MKSPTKFITVDKKVTLEFPSHEMRVTGNAVRLYGSSRIYWDRKRKSYVIETDNVVSLDGMLIGDSQ